MAIAKRAGRTPQAPLRGRLCVSMARSSSTSAYSYISTTTLWSCNQSTDEARARIAGVHGLSAGGRKGGGGGRKEEKRERERARDRERERERERERRRGGGEGDTYNIVFFFFKHHS